MTRISQYSQTHGETIRDCPVQGQELNLMIFVGPLKLSMFCDSVNICCLCCCAENSQPVYQGFVC